MALINLKRPKNVGSGVAERVFIAPVSFFAPEGIKTPTPPFTDPGDSVIIAESHEFLEGKGFIQIQLAPDKNQFSASTLGDKGFQKLGKELNVFIPGSYALLHEAVKQLLNVPLIVLQEDSNCGEKLIYQIGTECVPAYLTTDFSTGTTVDGVKGYVFKLTSTLGFIQLYEGDITKLADDDETEALKGLLTEDSQFLQDEDEGKNIWREEDEE